MMAKRVAMLVAGLVVSGSVLAQQPNSDLFRCELSNGKTVQISLQNGVPLYEYGAAHGSQMSPVELALPKTLGDKSQVRVAQISYSGGGAVYYRFINGPFSYVVFSGIGRGWEYTGLTVYKGEKRIMAKECKSGGYLGSDYRGENLVSDAETGDDNIYGVAG
ncbi:hypothetical protein [Plesiomonas shigelloides]|uniref:hypothetical protein n=1 Tax=Plesiomonas shigelloides TaxID=703 RepID=UPI001E5C553C|nr:hypothetical protein [Plesiomonas shigelloides]